MRRTVALLALALAAPCVALAQPKPPPLGAPAPRAPAAADAPGLRGHVDPAGFTIGIPQGWRLGAAGPAEIALLGPGERAVALVRARPARGPLDAWLARDWPGTEPQVAEARAVSVTAPARDVARGVFVVRDRAGVQRRAVVLAVRRGEVATLFIAAAPEGEPAASWRQAFAALDSFRLGGGAPGGGAALPLARWTDPQEAAFTVEIPAGWRPEGGLVRVGPTSSPRTALRATSPDGRSVIFIGDPAPPRFILPSPVLDNLGYREGMSYPGGTDIIMRFRHALEIGPEMLQRRLGPLQVTARRDRPEMARFRAERQPVMQGSSAHVTVGEADLRLADGRVGQLHVGTSGYVVPGLGGGWSVEEFYGFAGPPDQAAVLGATLARVVGSFAVDPRWFAREQRMQAVAHRGDQVYAGDVEFDLLVRAQVVDALAQREADEDVAEGDHVGNDRGRDREQEHVRARHAGAEHEVVHHAGEVGLGDAPLNVGQRVFAYHPAHDHGDEHARDHAEVGDRLGQLAGLDDVLEGQREQDVGRHDRADQQRDRRAVDAAAGLEFAHHGSDAGADDDAALERVRNYRHQLVAQAGEAEEQEDDEDLDLEREHRLDRFRPRLEVLQEQQHDRNRRRDPARHERHAEQRRQQIADAGDDAEGERGVIGHAEVLHQQRDHAQADDEHEQALHHLRELPAVMDEGQADLERPERPVGVLGAVLALEGHS